VHPSGFAAALAALADRALLRSRLRAGARRLVSESEAPLARELARGRPRIIDLSGRSTLWQLGALVRQARLVIANDTGISHIAAALGTRSVVVSSGADVARWAPLRSDLHEVLWADLPCRPCGHRICPTAHECAQAVSSAQVLAAARRALRVAPSD
jgi:ADP-heptose:LPS heptosyltransferase